MRFVKLLGCLFLIAVLVVAGLGFWGWRQLHTVPAGGHDGGAAEGGEVTYQVESGTSAGQVLRDLEAEGILANADLARLWLVYGLGDPSIHAGLYRFERGASMVQVLERLIGGDVVQLQATVIEGLTLEETADALVKAGFGEREALLAAMRDPSPIADLDPEAETLEGYLFPETYSFPSGTTEEQIVGIMVDTFRSRWEDEVVPLLDGAAARSGEDGDGSAGGDGDGDGDEGAITPGGFAATDAERLDRVATAEDTSEPSEANGSDDPSDADQAGDPQGEAVAAEAPERPSVRELVILASIVEKEAGAVDERPLVAAVYRNRLDQGIGLYADPTVIYALKLAGTWDGNIRKQDLQMDSPYNTYRYRGLPPSPIASPGLASLKAAARPADVSYLYFVSRNDGTHVFSDTYAEHQRNVERWQRQYWRDQRARERAAAEDASDD